MLVDKARSGYTGTYIRFQMFTLRIQVTDVDYLGAKQVEAGVDFDPWQ